MKKTLLIILMGAILISVPASAQEVLEQSPKNTDGFKVRLKDIGKIVETRDNQLLGFGLVVGLRNTGDSRTTKFTQTALTNLLKKMGIPKAAKDYESRNVASVIVTGTLPSYIRTGQTISVVVSSLGDATSLVGGTLLMTPLQGPDFITYAVAQGPVVVGGIGGDSKKGSYVKNQTTVGRVPNGAIVEVEVPVTSVDQDNITIVLEDANFITAARAAKALGESGFEGAKAIDPMTLKVPLKEVAHLSYVEVIAKIENTELTPDTTSKVVINSRTGTVVIGEKVRLFPVAVTHGGISLKIEGGEESGARIVVVDAGESNNSSGVQITESGGKLVHLAPEATLSGLVDALNEMGVPAKDMISILQALKESGALIADLEVI